MFDGQISYFLLLIFFFWVVETIAKARQRSRHPEQTPEDSVSPPTPTTVEGAETARPQPQLERPRSLWEQIAEIARQAEAQRPGPAERVPPKSSQSASGGREGPQRRAVPAGGARAPARPSEFPPPTPAHGHGAPTRWEEGFDREPTARAGAAEGAAADERRSDRWLEGSRGEGAVPEGTAVEASGPGELTRFEQTDASRRRADLLARRPGPAPVQPGTVQPPAATTAPATFAASRAARSAAGKARRAPRPRSVPAAAPQAAARQAETSIRGLRGASRAELRRLLILQEVLGPPVALKEGPLAKD